MDMGCRALVTWRCWARKDWPGGTIELDCPLSRDSIAIFWKFKLCDKYNMYISEHKANYCRLFFQNIYFNLNYQILGTILSDIP